VVTGQNSTGLGDYGINLSRAEGWQEVQADNRGDLMHTDMTRNVDCFMLEQSVEQEIGHVQEEEQEGIWWVKNGKRYYLPADLGV
jgi:hypothetical protein